MVKFAEVQVDQENETYQRSWSDKLSSLRYLIIRTIGCPVPFLKNWVPIIGGRTIIEILMIIVVCIVSIPQSLSDFGDAGVVADYLMMMTILLGFRNNILTYILGMSFERIIYWHKLIAVLAIVITIIHAFEGMNLSGLLIILTMGIMGLTYLIKPYLFEGFYYVHIIGVVLLIPFGFLHFAKVYQYICLVWFIDILLRYVVTMRKISTVATLLPGDVVRIRFSHCFNYHCGQYCFLMIKEISPFDFHPFSLSSTPEDEVTSFHIRELGGWSRDLAKYIREEHQRQNPNHTPNSNTPISIPLNVYVEGPYGAKMVDVENPNYEVFLLISGGIGITPLQSVYNHLIHQSTGGRKLRKVIFIWSVKDRAMVDAMYADKLHSDVETHNQHIPYLPLSFQPPMTPPPVSRVIHVKEKSLPVENKIIHVGLHNSGDPTEGDVQQNINSQYIFYNEYYLTKVRPTDTQHVAGIHPRVQKWLKFGRPDIPMIFQQVAELCKSEGFTRVAVCVCGPSPMVNEVSDLCRLSKLNPNCQTVRFDCHQEVFDF